MEESHHRIGGSIISRLKIENTQCLKSTHVFELVKKINNHFQFQILYYQSNRRVIREVRLTLYHLASTLLNFR